MGRGRLAGAVTIRIKHDLTVGALYITLTDGEFLCTREVGPDVMVDLDMHWRVLGIEVLCPGRPWPLAQILARYKVSDEDREALLTGYPFHPPQVSAAIPAPAEITGR